MLNDLEALEVFASLCTTGMSSGISPVAAQMGSWPETKTKDPAAMPWE